MLGPATSRHTVTVLDATTVKGAQGGNSTTYAAASPTPRTLTCTVVPDAGGRNADLLKQQGYFKFFKVYFSADPQPLDGRQRLSHNGDVLRVMSPVENAHGLNRLWSLNAAAHTDDNPGSRLA